RCEYLRRSQLAHSPARGGVWPPLGRSRGGRSRAAFLVQAAGADRLGHVLRLLAVDGAVLELDPRVLLLAGALNRVGAIAPPLFLDDLVVDSLLVEGLLHFPTRVTRELDPDVGATMELERHQPPSFGRISVTPSRTVSITEVTRGS